MNKQRRTPYLVSYRMEETTSQDPLDEAEGQRLLPSLPEPFFVLNSLRHMLRRVKRWYQSKAFRLLMSMIGFSIIGVCHLLGWGFVIFGSFQITGGNAKSINSSDDHFLLTQLKSYGVLMYGISVLVPVSIAGNRVFRRYHDQAPSLPIRSM